MRIFKFGGASVKDAASVRNVATIIKQFNDRPLVVVVSAMAKTTNALEAVVHAWVNQQQNTTDLFADVIKFHKHVAQELFEEIPNTLLSFFESQTQEIAQLVQVPSTQGYGQAYDAVVHRGEMLSSQIIAAFLSAEGIKTHWLDARTLVQTNDAHRRATVNWPATEACILGAVRHADVYITQGFIGAAADGTATTLGREGSDYTAAVFANVLSAQDVTIWKDVPGVLNGDPKVFANTVLLEEISYREAIELAYYGASVIHPKTVQPLQAKSIPLYVRSFLDPTLPGTVIGKGLLLKPLVPCYIRKTEQALISIRTRDLAFIVEEHLQLIYSIFHTHGLTVSTMQNSAVSTSFCVNNDPAILPRVLKALSEHFEVRHNTGLSLYTIRHHNPEVRQALLNGHEPILEQITRETYQVVL